MADSFDQDSNLEQLRDVLCNKSGDVALLIRFRALFFLKSIGSEFESNLEKLNTLIKYIAECFRDDSELLKHEVLYVLGQSKNMTALPVLREVLKDNQQQVMVRHELLELLGLLNDKDSLDLLVDYFKNDPSEEIRQTCELLIERIKWANSNLSKEEILTKSLYESIDPAPPMAEEQENEGATTAKVARLQQILNDQEKPLFERYRLMFRLRDIGTDELALLLLTGFLDKSALFKHEIAYVFGQLCNPVTVPLLIEVLKDTRELGMVRHELLELLGSILTDEVLPVLQSFLNDEEDVVRDSAIVALDMYEYENSNEVEYATV